MLACVRILRLVGWKLERTCKNECGECEDSDSGEDECVCKSGSEGCWRGAGGCATLLRRPAVAAGGSVAVV